MPDSAKQTQRQLTGTVVSNKPDKTVIVAIERKIMHPVYGKSYRHTKRLAVHDPENKHKVGELVTIAETRPLSASKRFVVVETSK